MKRPALRLILRNSLGDLNPAAYQWSDDQLNDYLNRAILEYSQHFPLYGQATLESDDGAHEFNLPLNARSLLSVQYPASQVPPRWLERRAHTHADFYVQDGFYDVIWKGDDTTTSLLLISDAGQAGRYISVEYTYNHPELSNDTTNITVEARHRELLVLYVRLCVIKERSSEITAESDPSSISLGNAELNVFRAERDYKNRLEQCKASAMESGRAVWVMDKWS